MTKLDRIQNTDCVQGMAKLAAGSVDLVFADPPFNIGYDYDEYDDKREAGDYLGWSRDWINGVKRVLKPEGTFWLAIGDEFAAELKVLCTRELGFHCRSWVVWFFTFGVHCKYKFTRSHTHLFHFVKDNKKFTFNSLDVRVPSARELVYGDKRADPDGRVPDDTWMMAPVLPPEVPTRDGFVLRPQDLPDRFPSGSDTWFFSRVAGTFKERAGFHGCQMPEQLLGRIIRASSNEGDLVLDPFAGSGTTPAVTKKLGRRFLGFEISKKYASQIERRLAPIKPGDPLDGPENAAKSAPSTVNGRRLMRTPSRGRHSISHSPILASANFSLGQVAVSNREYATAIAEAFMAAHQGYSADRLLADPVLNDRFIRNCRMLGIPGDAKEWNHQLLDIRKRGGLGGVNTPRRTLVRRIEMEPYIFASEIAWRKVSNESACSLDDILCDPDLAGRFESVSNSIAPGYSSFHYRWAALSIRKDASLGIKLVNRFNLRLVRRMYFAGSNRLPDEPGHYLIIVNDVRFYLGFSESLRSCPFFDEGRLANALTAMQLPFKQRQEIIIRYRKFDAEPLTKSGEFAEPVQQKSACRAKLLSQYRPIANAKYPVSVFAA